MHVLNKRRNILIFLLFFIFNYNGNCFARDIDLDKIYIKSSSYQYSDLIDLKLKSYEISHASRVDNNVIFAGWTSGNRMIYIKELNQSKNNSVYEYYPASRIKRKLYTINGDIVFSKMSMNGHFLFMKTMSFRPDQTFDYQLVIINLRKNRIYYKQSDSLYKDFTISFYGDSIYYENDRGIVEYNPETGVETIKLYRSLYKHLFSSENKTLAYISPFKDKILLVNGGGGSYKSYLLFKGKFSQVKGITSTHEILWVDNTSFVYRYGYIGNYGVKMFNSITKKSHNLINRSLNTNITLSPYDNYITFLNDGFIHFYYKRNNYLKYFPVEGEDVVFSPAGNTFASLFNKQLFITNYSNVIRKNVELRRNAKDILFKYQEILKDKSILLNNYSDDYIERKINQYSKFNQ